MNLDSIGRAFADAHQHNPELCVWVYINEVPRPTGPGSLQFCELASRAVRALAVSTASDEDWKRWIDVLVGYLLNNDAGDEYIRKYPVCHLDRPEGTTPKTHPA
jgi:hypothetical protein